jgi:hypothetical protein
MNKIIWPDQNKKNKKIKFLLKIKKFFFFFKIQFFQKKKNKA